jgi:hypothetical protein
VSTSCSRFREGEGVEDFTMRLAGIIVHQLATLGDPELDDKVVLKYLRIARSRYRQLVLSIETLLDVFTLSIEEVTDRLWQRTMSLRHRPWKGSCSCLRKSGMRGARKRKPTRDPGVDPLVIAAAVAEVAATMEEAEAVAVVAMGLARLAGAGTQTVTAAANQTIGLRTREVSSPRRMRLHSRPKRRSPFFLLRSTPSRRRDQSKSVVSASLMEECIGVF